jgi:hypothetical protein
MVKGKFSFTVHAGDCKKSSNRGSMMFLTGFAARTRSFDWGFKLFMSK